MTMSNVDRATLKQRCIEVLNEHQGPENCITMEQLFRTISGDVVIPYKCNNQSRIVRELVAQLQGEGHSICHKSGKYGGYFLATKKEHIEKEAKWHRARGLSSLRRSKYLLKQTDEQLLNQLKIDLNDEEQGNE